MIEADIQNLDQYEARMLIRLEIAEHSDSNTIHQDQIPWKSVESTMVTGWKSREIRRFRWKVPSNFLSEGRYMVRLVFDRLTFIYAPNVPLLKPELKEKAEQFIDSMKVFGSDMPRESGITFQNSIYRMYWHEVQRIHPLISGGMIAILGLLFAAISAGLAWMALRNG